MTGDNHSQRPNDRETIGDDLTELDDAGRMAQLRDILFGHDKSDLHRRIDQLESRLSHETSALTEHFQAMVEELKTEITDIKSELRQNQNTRQAISTLLEELAAQLKDPS
ncbi:hypothetical protein [Rhabdochromatium marinum]|uniref:hypothetical protein n=1 Tax=Rhabdochromatium marinum TaxID=48729 RepID=UPI001904AFB2|nr:hypothetical protein [Rhabdochromatium marinum]MBK1648404.1 hypothetical protein [Rhabdochromatium marinum]